MPNADMQQKVIEVRGAPASLEDMLTAMGALDASDLFLKTGSTIRFKIGGSLAAFDSETITQQHMEHFISCFLLEEDRRLFHERLTADIVYAGEHARYRVHFAYGQTGPYAAIRIISAEIKPFRSLGLPEQTQNNLANLQGGLLIVSGTTDAGKTVTCTSLLQHFNDTRQLGILTLEDPVEYILVDNKSLIIQREVGVHTKSFVNGIRSALRESLDIIFVGEMRDAETMEQVLRAAEMGHLVVTSVHADDALSALMRIIGTFPQVDQPRIAQSLASTLSGVIYQRLLPRAGGGRVPCVETLWSNTAVRSILRGGDLTKLGSYVGTSSGGVAYRESLAQLTRQNAIERETFDAEVARLTYGR